ncbi:MAG TPA: hypothetical protein PLA11_02265 [Flavobacteriales bacterium]|nr:hypothetical protein [Flavobacteriales bacterium]
MNMGFLHPDWILHPAIDREMKQYILLAYLQRVGERFGQHRLHPYLDDLRGHLKRMHDLRTTWQALRRCIPTEVTGLDPRRGGLARAPLEDPEVLRVVVDVLSFAEPELQAQLEQAEDLREQLAGTIVFAPVGLLPLTTKEGYLLLRQDTMARAYRYDMHVLRESDDTLRYRNVHTHWVTDYSLGIGWTYERVKADLIRRHPDLPVPSTFAFESGVTLPRIETFLPLAKELVYDALAAEGTR